MTDLTRKNNYMQKKGFCIFAGSVEEGTEDNQVSAINGDHLLGNLPPDAIITNAYMHVVAVSDAGTSLTGKLGTASAGGEILTAANLKAAVGKVGTFAGQTLTGSGVPIWLSLTYVGTAATNIGKYIVVVEYLEYTKNTGELTKI